MTIDPTELVRLKALAEAARAADINNRASLGKDGYLRILSLVADNRLFAALGHAGVLALIAEVERPQSELAQVSEIACERRAQLQTQTDLRVAAEERAGRKNVARLEAEVERLKAELASARVPRVPRTPVGPFTNGQLKSRPILLETDDAALGQLRDLVNALGNWHDFAAFNEVVRASARELSEAERTIVDIVLNDYGATEGRQSELHSAIEAARALRAKKAGE